MKTTDAITALSALNALAGKNLPFKFAYASSRNRRKLVELAEIYEGKRKELLDQFAKKDEEGALVHVKVKGDGGEREMVQLTDAKAFNDGLEAIGNEEISDLKLHMVKLEDCPAEIDPAILEALIVVGMVPDEVAA